MKIRLMFYAFFCVGALYAQPMPWTWQYHKLLSTDELTTMKNELVFTKLSIPAFTQLLFSWNAFRQKNAHYSFFVQVRDQQTKVWGSWHKMIDWGSLVQKSYLTKSDGMSRYVHVRLETEQHKKGDAFRVKIMSRNPADLCQLRSFTVNASDYGRFQP